MDLKQTHIYKQGAQYALELDVYLPANAPKPLPVVLYLHAGALIFGNRAAVNKSELEAIMEQGMAYVAVDYRLAPETKLMDIAGDVQDAIAWVRGDGARQYGFDTDRVAVLGKSAGGYLALLSGTFDNRPNAIVSFYGYGDILGDWYALPSPHYSKYPPVTQGEADACIQAGVPSHTGVEGRFPLYLRTRQTGTWASLVSGYDPVEAKTALTPYCPIRNIDSEFPTTLLLHGSADTDVPVEQSEAIYDALTAAGVPAQLCVLPGVGHMFDDDWGCGSDEFGRVTRFLKEALS